MPEGQPGTASSLPRCFCASAETQRVPFQALEFYSEIFSCWTPFRLQKQHPLCKIIYHACDAFTVYDLTALFLFQQTVTINLKLVDMVPQTLELVLQLFLFAQQFLYFVLVIGNLAFEEIMNWYIFRCITISLSEYLRFIVIARDFRLFLA